MGNVREQGGRRGEEGCEWQADKQRKGSKKKRSSDSGAAEGVIKMESDREKGRELLPPFPLPPSLHPSTLTYLGRALAQIQAPSLP